MNAQSQSIRQMLQTIAALSSAGKKEEQRVVYESFSKHKTRGRRDASLKARSNRRKVAR